MAKGRDVVSELIEHASERRLTLETISACALEEHQDLTSLVDRVSVEIARRYLASEMTFIQADAQISRIWSLLMHHVSRLPIPETTERVYRAFEEGEYVHVGDARELDAGEKYTRPLLEQILQIPLRAGEVGSSN